VTTQEILGRIDHTLLKAAASWEEIKTLCNEAVRFNTASVCIPPCYVQPVFNEFGSSPVICTVTGFPLGYSASAVKLTEAGQAIKDGAREIDTVINIGDVKNGCFDRVLAEIRLLREICENRILKVIVETCYLTEEEKIRLCGIVTEAGADFIKTSTGFGTAGAALADIQLFTQHIGPGVKIKAAGGIKTREDLEAFIAAGADRIGTSSAIKLLAGETATGY
jgi:deoxyribose-phosphate aldolase